MICNKGILIFFSIIISLVVHGQSIDTYTKQQKTNLNLFAQHILADTSLYNQTVHVIISGNTSTVVNLIEEAGGLVKYSQRNLVSAMLKVNQLKLLENKPGIDFIEFTLVKGQPLVENSLLLSQTNVVHQGNNLPENLTGKGVLVGLIDTGIDFNHPDFKDSLGNTRILNIWDQTKPQASNTPQPYGYGQAWDSTQIQNQTLTHTDPYSFYGHGTNVAGILGGNGLSVSNPSVSYQGYAPNAKFLVVASNFNSNNWAPTVADAVHYIFSMADSLNRPCVINASLGIYIGSHDGTDAPAQIIDGLLKAKLGRAMVCAAGNSGTNQPYHLGYQATPDTQFTFFKPNPNSIFGGNQLFYELWADTASLNQVYFDFEVVDTINFQSKGKSGFKHISQLLNQNITDTIFDTLGNFVAKFSTYAEVQGSKYLLQVFFQNPPQNNFYSLKTTGAGRFDIWSGTFFGFAEIVSANLPNANQNPNFTNYQYPDTFQSIVSSWACLPSVLTIGNYNNRNTYFDVDSVLQTLPEISGKIANSSSQGPTRNGLLKPDFCAPGANTLTAGLAQDLSANLAIPALRSFVGLGGYHRRAGGTSMASPAVAGSIALYLEKCPKANYSEIIQAFNSTSFFDSLTAPTPNTKWGNGKLNTLEALKTSNFKPQILLNADTVLCPNEQVTLQAQAGFLNYSWNKTSTQATSLVVDTSGQYYFTCQNLSGCKGYSDSITITLQNKPILKLPNDTIICYNQSLTVSVPTSFQQVLWSDSTTGLQASFNAGKTIWVWAANAYGCSNTDTMVLGKFPQPNVQLPNDTQICYGDTLVLQVNNFDSVLWDNNSNKNTRTLFTTGNYWVKITDSLGCQAIDSFSILNFLPIPKPNLPNTLTGCIGDIMLLETKTPAYSFHWNNGSTASSQQISVSGTYILTITDSNFCRGIDTTTATFLPQPVFSLGPDSVVCANTNQVITLNAPENMAQYVWSNGFSGNKMYACNYPQSACNLVFGSSTLVWLEIKNSVGCTYRDSIVLQSVIPDKINLGSNMAICANNFEPVVLNINNSKLSHINWSTGENQNTILATQFGWYWVSARDSLNCFTADTILIDSLPVPNFKLLENLGKTDTLTVTKSNFNSPIPGFFEVQSPIVAKSYLWSNGTQIANALFEIPTNQIFMQLWLQVTNQEGCTFTDSVWLNWLDVSVLESKLLDYKVFPNPAKTILNIEWNHSKPITLKLIDVTGKVVLENKTINNGNLITLNTQNIAPGVYLLIIENHQNIFEKHKIIIKP